MPAERVDAPALRSPERLACSAGPGRISSLFPSLADYQNRPPLAPTNKHGRPRAPSDPPLQHESSSRPHCGPAVNCCRRLSPMPTPSSFAHTCFPSGQAAGRESRFPAALRVPGGNHGWEIPSGTRLPKGGMMDSTPSLSSLARSRSPRGGSGSQSAWRFPSKYGFSRSSGSFRYAGQYRWPALSLRLGCVRCPFPRQSAQPTLRHPAGRDKPDASGEHPPVRSSRPALRPDIRGARFGNVREVLLASGGSVEWHPLLPFAHWGINIVRPVAPSNESAFEGGTFQSAGRCRSRLTARFAFPPPSRPPPTFDRAHYVNFAGRPQNPRNPRRYWPWGLRNRPRWPERRERPTDRGVFGVSVPKRWEDIYRSGPKSARRWGDFQGLPKAQGPARLPNPRPLHSPHHLQHSASLHGSPPSKVSALGHDAFHPFLPRSLRNRPSERPSILPLSDHFSSNPLKPNRHSVLDAGRSRFSLCRCGKRGRAAGEGVSIPAALRAPDGDRVGELIRRTISHHKPPRQVCPPLRDTRMTKAWRVSYTIAWLYQRARIIEHPGSRFPCSLSVPLACR